MVVEPAVEPPIEAAVDAVEPAVTEPVEPLAAGGVQPEWSHSADPHVAVPAELQAADFLEPQEADVTEPQAADAVASQAGDVAETHAPDLDAPHATDPVLSIDEPLPRAAEATEPSASDAAGSPSESAAETTETTAEAEQPAQEPEQASPLDARTTDAAPPNEAAPGPAVAPAEQERFDLLCRKVEAAIAALEGHASRVSALSGGTRFSTLQKTHYGFVSEFRTLRAQRPDEPTFNGLQSLLERIERLDHSLMPPRGSEASGTDTPAGEAPPRAARSAGSLRQALIRGMILLAPAPLHLQLEFAPEFPLAEADPIALASRSHAVNRAALGSLRRIQWESPDRCSLWFGEGEQRQVVAASFDEQGKVVLPPEFRQKQNPPGQGASRTPRASGGAAGASTAGARPCGRAASARGPDGSAVAVCTPLRARRPAGPAAARWRAGSFRRWRPASGRRWGDRPVRSSGAAAARPTRGAGRTGWAAPAIRRGRRWRATRTVPRRGSAGLLRAAGLRRTTPAAGSEPAGTGRSTTSAKPEPAERPEPAGQWAALERGAAVRRRQRAGRRTTS